jgi:hypothetical protein
MKCAIATVAIGQDYQSSYAAVFRPSVERYVARHGYDLVLFTDYLGEPRHRDPRLITFMKILAPYHEAVLGYDLLMVLDVDILINARAPPFHALEIGSNIGVVDEWCQPSPEERMNFQMTNGLETSARDYYRLAGFNLESEILINSGMFVCAPVIHSPFFRDIVARYSETQRSHPRGPHFEQAMFGYELKTNGLAHLLPIKWNCIWPHYRRSAKWGAPAQTDTIERWADVKRFREVFDATYLLHMTGGLDHDLAFLCRNR